LSYTVDGTGGEFPLVLLQRFRGTVDDWDPAFVAALASKRQVIRFDSAGIGGSEGETPVSVSEMSKVAIAFLGALNLAKVDLLGWSLGGFVTQHVALDAPHLVRRLIIAGSGPGGTPEGPRTDPKIFKVATKPVSDDEDFLVLFYPETETAISAGRESIDRIKHVQNKAPDVTVDSFMRQGQALGTWEGVRSRLAELKLPVLVANGVDDVMIPAYGSYVISQEAPNAKLVLYPNAGHGFLFQHISDFAGEVNGFLGS
jgi:pimeloyl-ACP methyl ester carboxylesterase